MDLQNNNSRKSNLRSESGVDESLETFLVNEKKGGIKWKKVLPAVYIFLSTAILMIGLILIGMANKKDSAESIYSKEAQRAGFIKYLEKVEKIAKDFETFDPRPEKFKERTDVSLQLLDELNKKNIDVKKLNLREKRAFSQVRFNVRFSFLRVFDFDYYTGDWMMGPNSFCWQDLCTLYGPVNQALQKAKPINKESVKNLKIELSGLGKTVEQYIENMKLGVKAGMVRAKEDCEAGLTTIKVTFLHVSMKNERGILEETFVKKYFKSLEDKNEEVLATDLATMKTYLVEYIGKSIVNLIRYMENEHLRHCVPSSVSSGLGNLPVDYIYVDGTADLSRPTTKKLPTGEKLSGKKSYKKKLFFFTTEDMTAEEIFKLGQDLLKTSYAEMIEYAKNYTGLQDELLAEQKLKDELKKPSMYFATNLPEEESNEAAHKKCVSEETARIHCPKRYAVMTTWLKSAREVTNHIQAKLTDVFYFTSKLQVSAGCPLKLGLDFNPSSGAQSYHPGTRQCSSSPEYHIPFWMDKPGPKYYEWLITAHETNPGHHLQYQGYLENYLGIVDDAITRLDRVTMIIPFIEGWANYAFDPVLISDTDLFEEPEGKLNKFSIHNEKVWGAVRFMVEAGLHHYGYTRDWALELFEKYVWMTGDMARKEVTRYQSNPGQGIAYTIGQTHIHNLRKYTQKKLGKKFDLRDFHFQVLSQGSTTLDHHTQHIEKYVQCVLDSTEDGCDQIINAAGNRGFSTKDEPKQSNSYTIPTYTCRRP